MKIFYAIAQWTWGFVQSLVGLIVFLAHAKCRHYMYRGALVTQWSKKSSVSLGFFIFVAKEPYRGRRFAGVASDSIPSRLLVHEYGHTIQSLILGPLYLIIIGIPSLLWAALPAAAKKRKVQQLSYFSFFTERWANYLGERATKQKSMEQLLID